MISSIYCCIEGGKETARHNVSRGATTRLVVLLVLYLHRGKCTVYRFPDNLFLEQPPAWVHVTYTLLYEYIVKYTK